MMKPVYMLALGVFGCALGSLAWGQAADLSKLDIVLKSVPDGPVARVDKHSISGREFVRFYNSELERALEENGNTDMPDEARVQLAMWCIGTLIQQELIFVDAEQRGITIEPGKAEETWTVQLRQLQAAFKARDGADYSETEVIEQLGHPDRDAMLGEIERALRIEKTRMRILQESGVTVSDEDVERVFEQERDRYARPDALHLRQVFIPHENGVPPAPRTEAEAREIAEEALSACYAGKRFETVAKEYSEGRGRQSGGDLGLMPVSQLPPFLVEATVGLEEGEMSDIIESEYGFHIVEVVRREAASTGTLEDARRSIEGRLLARAGTQVVRDYCNRLIENGVFIRIFLELDRNIQALPEDHPLHYE